MPHFDFKGESVTAQQSTRLLFAKKKGSLLKNQGSNPGGETGWSIKVFEISFAKYKNSLPFQIKDPIQDKKD